MNRGQEFKAKKEEDDEGETTESSVLSSFGVNGICSCTDNWSLCGTSGNLRGLIIAPLTFCSLTFSVMVLIIICSSACPMM